MNDPQEPNLPAKGQFLVYQTEDGQLKIDVRLEDETAWLTQAHMAELFQTTVPNVSMHLRNVYAEGELQAAATVKDFLIVRPEGNRQVSRMVEHYNLDAIISVGYRVKSAVATQAENGRQEVKNGANSGHMNVILTIAPGCSANGAFSYQPGATPQVNIHSSHLGPKARSMAARFGSEWGLAPRCNGPSALHFVFRSIPGAVPQAGMGSHRWCSKRRNARDLEQNIAGNVAEILEA